MDMWGLLRQPGTREASESHLWANIGKATAVYLMLSHADVVVSHWEVLATFLATLVVPKVLERILVARFGGQPIYTSGVTGGSIVGPSK